MSGCKVIDLLDCLIDGRELLYYRVSTRKSQLGESSIVNMKIRYVLKRAWFTCLNVPCDSDNVFWRDQQRFMYLRLRRLICSINEHHLEKVRYDREMAEENLDSVRAMKLRIPSTYSGKGSNQGNNIDIILMISTFSVLGTKDAYRLFRFLHLSIWIHID